MAAVSTPSRRVTKQKKCVDGERRRSRSSDAEIALDLQLAYIVDGLDVDVLVVCDLDGAPVASAGDVDHAIDLAAFAAATAKDHGIIGVAKKAFITTRGFVHLDLIDARGRTFVVAALGKFAVPAPIGMARAVNGAARILENGLTLCAEAPLPLVERGAWGDWSELNSGR